MGRELRVPGAGTAGDGVPGEERRAQPFRPRRTRRNGRERTLSVAGSGVLHVLAVLIVGWSALVEPRPQEFVTYEINLASVPPPEEELVVETPDPALPEEVPDEETPTVEEPPSEEPEEEEQEPEPEPEPEPPPEEPSSEEPSEEPSTTSEEVNVRLEGLKKDYPAYYDNIIGQINRCFRPPRGVNLEATIAFVIRRDGTVSELDIVESSGNPEFDIRAVEAVECAGKGRLGVLPEDLPYDRLPVHFNFRPRGQDGMEELSDGDRSFDERPSEERPRYT